VAGVSSIHEFLREAHVPYKVVPHRPAFTAQEEAAATHVPGRDWAKVVICFVDGEPIEAVLPAPLTVNLDRLLELAGGSEIRLAQEEDDATTVSGVRTGSDAALRSVVRPVGVRRRCAGLGARNCLQRGHTHGGDRDALGRLRQQCQTDRREVR